MSCQKPVCIYVNSNWAKKAYNKSPPIINVKDSEDIYRKITRLIKDKKRLLKTGYNSREWIINNHSEKIVVNKHIELYKSLLK